MIGLYLLAAHFLGDWFLQSDSMAANKLSSPRVRFVHVTIYTATVTAVYGLAVSSEPAGVLAFATAIFVPHYGIDSRRWKDPVEGFPTRALWFDQAAHVINLAAAVAVAGLVLA